MSDLFIAFDACLDDCLIGLEFNSMLLCCWALFLATIFLMALLFMACLFAFEYIRRN